MESRDSGVCLLLVWGVCNQAFGRDIGPKRVPKSGHRTITKIENLHIALRRKIHWFQKWYSFRSKNNEVIAEKPSQNSGVTIHQAVGRRHYTLLVIIIIIIIIIINRGYYAMLSVCLYVCEQDNSRSSRQIWMKISGSIGYETRVRSDLDHSLQGRRGASAARG